MQTRDRKYQKSSTQDGCHSGTQAEMPNDPRVPLFLASVPRGLEVTDYRASHEKITFAVLCGAISRINSTPYFILPLPLSYC
jgi:hypothetical protein